MNAATIRVGDLTVNRLGFGALRSRFERLTFAFCRAACAA
jgi:hypothetical protein